MGSEEGPGEEPQQDEVREYELEAVFGVEDPELGDELVELWVSNGVLGEEAARERLGDVCFTLRDAEGRLVGVNSVYGARVPELGANWYWMYRTYVEPEAAAVIPAMLRETWEALGSEYTGGNDVPLGVCWLIPEGTATGAGAEAIWPGSEFMHAGFDSKDREIRVRFFEDALIDPRGEPVEFNLALAPGYEVKERAEADVTDEDLIGMWTSAGVLSEQEARERVDEVFTVGLGPGGEPAGVITIYRGEVKQLRRDMLLLRAFVSPLHRRSNLAGELFLRTRDRLQHGYDTEEHDLPGIVIQLQNEMLMRSFPLALFPMDYWFFGVGPDGSHLRVHWFEGAILD